MEKMSKVTNNTFQKIVLNLTSTNSINLMPKKSIILPQANLTSQIRNLEARGILKIRKV